MFSVETQVGIGMNDLGHGEPLLRDTLEKLPRIPAPLAATSDHPQPPHTAHELPARQARTAVAPHSSDPCSASQRSLTVQGSASPAHGADWTPSRSLRQHQATTL